MLDDAPTMDAANQRPIRKIFCIREGRLPKNRARETLHQSAGCIDRTDESAEGINPKNEMAKNEMRGDIDQHMLGGRVLPGSAFPIGAVPIIGRLAAAARD